MEMLVSDVTHIKRVQTVTTPPPIGERSIVMSVSVCLSLCLSFRDHIFGSTRPIVTEFFCAFLPMVVARSLCGGVVMCYVLPVLWMT